MKFPSIDYLGSQLANSFKRFYLPILFAIVGTYTAIIMIDSDDRDSLVRVLCSCILGISFSLGCILYAETSSKQIVKWISPVFATLFVIAYWYWLSPSVLFNDVRHTLMFFVLAIVTHLWVAVAAYISSNNITSFWRFNETLYTRVVVSALFSSVLFAGLSLAIFACNTLFKIEIKDTVYLKLFYIILGIFNTWFFLAGVPHTTALNDEKPFPKWIKIFAQYILLPLVVLYMVILYAYGGKITTEMHLPRGWVSTLIIWYTIAGILAILLVYPLRDSKENAWVRVFTKFFFGATLPLVVLLFIAIYARIKPYGFTEDRYYLMVLGLWLAGICLYFIFSAIKNIKYIPLSLAVIGFLSLFGPWSAFSISERSQMQRLEKILVKYKIWERGQKITNPGMPLREQDAADARSIIDFFVERKAIKCLQDIYPIDLNKMSGAIEQKQHTKGKYYDNWEAKSELRDTLRSMLHIPAKDNTDYAESYNSEQYLLAEQSGIDIAGYARIYHIELNSYNSQRPYLLMPGQDSIYIEVNKWNMIFKKQDRTIASLDLITLADSLKAGSSYTNLPVSKMTIVSTDSMLQFKMIISSVSFIYRPNYRGDVGITELESWIMFK
jgi:hypothetical protein